MTDQRELAAWHEAGHAVAAVMRGGSYLTSVTLSEQHGEGLTMLGTASWDSGFMAYAGPWAEARHLWRHRVEADDDEGLLFDDFLAAVFFEQPDDLAALQAARELVVLPPELDQRELERRSEEVWSTELEDVWPAIVQVAHALLADVSVTDDMVRSLVEHERR